MENMFISDVFDSFKRNAWNSIGRIHEESKIKSFPIVSNIPRAREQPGLSNNVHKMQLENHFIRTVKLELQNCHPRIKTLTLENKQQMYRTSQWYFAFSGSLPVEWVTCLIHKQYHISHEKGRDTRLYHVYMRLPLVFNSLDKYCL